MSEALSMDLVTLLMFSIPGYFVVWTFHKFNKSKSESDFERLVFSFFWGSVLLVSYSLLAGADQFRLLVSNPFATMLSMSVLAYAMGFVGYKAVELYKLIEHSLKTLFKKK